MLMGSVLELQADVFQKDFGFVEFAAAAAGDAAGVANYVDPRIMEGQTAPATATSSKPTPTQDIALGVAPRPDEHGYQLAVLVQNRRLLRSDLVEKIVRRARREAEIAYIGRQVALWTRVAIILCVLCSTSPANVNFSGTLGCFCRDNVTSTIGILSNNHVLATVNTLPAGTSIIQQSGGDTGNSATDIIATLTRFSADPSLGACRTWSMLRSRSSPRTAGGRMARESMMVATRRHRSLLCWQATPSRPSSAWTSSSSSDYQAHIRACSCHQRE